MLTKAYIYLIFLVITVHAVPIIDEMVGRNATKGESFTFSCTFHGNGPLVIARWVRNGIVYKENLNGSKEQTLNLTFNDVQPEDKGSYDCEVMDADGSDSRSVQLNVFMAPEITFANKSIEYVSPQTNFNLVCDVSAFPAANWTWYFNGSLIENDNENKKIMPIENGGSKLQILEFMDPENYGNYTCVATNEIGANNFTTTLLKKVSPKTPLLTCHGNNKSSIHCYDPVESNKKLHIDSPDNYIVSIMEEAQDTTTFCCTGNSSLMDCDSKQGVYSFGEGDFWIHNLKPGTEYVLQVTAQNSAGASEMTDCIFVEMSAGKKITGASSNTILQSISLLFDKKPNGSSKIFAIFCIIFVLLVTLIIVDVLFCLIQGKGLMAIVHRRFHRRTSEPTVKWGNIEAGNQSERNVILLKTSGRTI